MIHNLAADVMAFTSNAFLVTGDRTVLVDPGANFDVLAALDRHVDTIDAIVLTHTHPDHIGNTDDVVDRYEVEVWGYDGTHDLVDHELGDEDTLTIGDHEYVAVHTPGHNPDHLCLYAGAAGILFAGDLIFQNGSYGRTDLPEGNHRQLVESIEIIATVVDPELAELHPGHGPSITENAFEHIELARQFAGFG